MCFDLEATNFSNIFFYPGEKSVKQVLHMEIIDLQVQRKTIELGKNAGNAGFKNNFLNIILKA